MIRNIKLTKDAKGILEQKLAEYELLLIERMANTGKSFDYVCATTEEGWKYKLGKTLYLERHVDVGEQYRAFQKQPVFRENPGIMPDEDDFYRAGEFLHELLYKGCIT